MSRKIDSLQNTQPLGPGKTRGDGSRTRYAFTFAILLGALAAIFAFYTWLGQTTQSADSRLSIQTRSTDQIYVSAATIDTEVLRLRALRNFANAYPDSPEAEMARNSVAELELAEHEAWRAASEVYFDVSAKVMQKQAALDAFAARWDGGTYREELASRMVQLGGAPPVVSGEADAEREAAPPLAGRDIAPPRREIASGEAADRDAITSDDLAGGFAPRARMLPLAATLPIEPVKPMPVITEATIKRRVKPSYPSRARRKGVEAVVTISMDIGADGRVKDARIVKAATGDYAADFGRAALRAAKRTRFNPKLIDGKPAPTNGFTQPYRFTISD